MTKLQRLSQAGTDWEDLSVSGVSLPSNIESLYRMDALFRLKERIRHPASAGGRISGLPLTAMLNQSLPRQTLVARVSFAFASSRRGILTIHTSDWVTGLEKQKIQSFFQQNFEPDGRFGLTGLKEPIFFLKQTDYFGRTESEVKRVC